VAIDGSWRLLRYNMFPVPFGVRVRVSIGAPIVRRPGDDPGRLLEQAEAWIRATIQGWRASDTARRETEAP
jgi:hypothetical protein